MKITTKGEMYRLLYSGRFGNYPLAWESLEELLASGYQGLSACVAGKQITP